MTFSTCTIIINYFYRPLCHPYETKTMDAFFSFQHCCNHRWHSFHERALKESKQSKTHFICSSRVDVLCVLTTTNQGKGVNSLVAIFIWMIIDEHRDDFNKIFSILLLCTSWNNFHVFLVFCLSVNFVNMRKTNWIQMTCVRFWTCASNEKGYRKKKCFLAF